MADNQKQVIQPQLKQEEVKKEKGKCCPFLTLPVMVQNKLTQRAEPQLRINLCMQDNCALFINGKCGLIK